jgi:hypothetical protein
MSSNKAASPPARSAIDRLSLAQDTAPADRIAAFFDRLTLDQIDRPIEQGLQGILEVGKSGQVMAGLASAVKLTRKSASLVAGSKSAPRAAEPNTASCRTP